MAHTIPTIHIPLLEFYLLLVTEHHETVVTTSDVTDATGLAYSTYLSPLLATINVPVRVDNCHYYGLHTS